MNVYILGWYFVGIIGAINCRLALQYGRISDTFTIGSVVVGALFSLLGPMTLAWGLIWWCCALLERHPACEWEWVQPIRRVWKKEL